MQGTARGGAEEGVEGPQDARLHLDDILGDMEVPSLLTLTRLVDEFEGEILATTATTDRQAAFLEVLTKNHADPRNLCFDHYSSTARRNNVLGVRLLTFAKQYDTAAQDLVYRLWGCGRMVTAVYEAAIATGIVGRLMDVDYRKCIPPHLNDEQKFEAALATFVEHDEKNLNSFQNAHTYLMGVLASRDYRRNGDAFFARVRTKTGIETIAFEEEIKIAKFVHLHCCHYMYFKAYKWSTDSPGTTPQLIKTLTEGELKDALPLEERKNLTSYAGDSIGLGAGVYDCNSDFFFPYLVREEWEKMAALATKVRSRLDPKYTCVPPSEADVAVIHLDTTFPYDIYAEICRLAHRPLGCVWREADPFECPDPASEVDVASSPLFGARVLPARLCASILAGEPDTSVVEWGVRAGGRRWELRDGANVRSTDTELDVAPLRVALEDALALDPRGERAQLSCDGWRNVAMAEELRTTHYVRVEGGALYPEVVASGQVWCRRDQAARGEPGPWRPVTRGSDVPGSLRRALLAVGGGEAALSSPGGDAVFVECEKTYERGTLVCVEEGGDGGHTTVFEACAPRASSPPPPPGRVWYRLTRHEDESQEWEPPRGWTRVPAGSDLLDKLRAVFLDENSLQHAAASAYVEAEGSVSAKTYALIVGRGGTGYPVACMGEPPCRARVDVGDAVGVALSTSLRRGSYLRAVDAAGRTRYFRPDEGRTWRDCAMPPVERIYGCQRFVDHDRFFLYALKGRTFFYIGERDTCEGTLMLEGVGGCGKSTILKGIMCFKPPHRRGILSPNMQPEFGMAEVADADVVFCNEVGCELKVVQEEWQTATSGEWGSYNVKFGKPKSCKWRPMFVWAGNGFPPFNNKEFQVSRRMYGVLLAVPVSPRDGGIMQSIERQLGAFQRKMLLAYGEWVRVVGKTDPISEPDTRLPPAFRDYYHRGRRATNPVLDFLLCGEWVKPDESSTESVPMEQVKELYKGYRQKNGLSVSLMRENAYRTAFAECGVVVVRETTPNGVKKEWVRGLRVLEEEHAFEPAF
jgi:hypothetical protein